MFTPLTQGEIRQIAVLLLNGVRKNLARRELKLEASDSALDLLADLGYDPQFGARPLKRVIQKEIVNELSKQLLGGEFTDGDIIYVDTDAKGFTFRHETPVAEEVEIDEVVEESNDETKQKVDELLGNSNGNGTEKDAPGDVEDAEVIEDTDQ